jgi:hypothetical protein
MQSSLQCALSHSQDPCGFGEVPFFKVIHEDCVSISLGQGKHGASDSFGALMLLEAAKHARCGGEKAIRVEAQ